MEGTTRQGTSNVKCLCTPAFIALAVANYNCEIPLGLSNLRALSADRKPNMDRLHAESQIQSMSFFFLYEKQTKSVGLLNNRKTPDHVAQCKALGIDLTPGLPQVRRSPI